MRFARRFLRGGLLIESAVDSGVKMIGSALGVFFGRLFSRIRPMQREHATCGSISSMTEASKAAQRYDLINIMNFDISVEWAHTIAHGADPRA